jgi:hypothetical protein
MAVTSSDLSDRFAAAEIDRLGRRLGGALRDNPEGVAVFAIGLKRAVEIGFEAQCAIAGPPPDGSESGELWERWHAQRQLAPEAASWPERLTGDGKIGLDAIAAAEDALLEAGAELGLTTRGRSMRRALREIGAQAAEAGAALRCAVDDDAPELAPTPAVASPDLGAPPRDGYVRVAAATNQPECEMLQDLLAKAGIPSTWSRGMLSAPDMLAGGYRDVYVPVSAADEARIVLSTAEPSPVGVADPVTRTVGMERAWLRRSVKAMAAYYVVGVVVSASILRFVGASADALLATLALVVAASIAVMAWSERR